MLAPRVTILVPTILAVGCTDWRSDAAVGRDSIAVEVTAVQAMLGKYSARVITVDSLFASADEAPPHTTGSARPPMHQRTLLDTLRHIPRVASGDSLHVRTSRPSFLGSKGRISVTVDEFRAGASNKSDYETVVFTLYLQEGRWVIHNRAQLGQS